MRKNVLNFEEGWNKMISDLKEPKTFDTIGGRKKFTIRCTNGKIVFLSPYEGCTISKSEMRKVYQRFMEIKGWKTSDYTSITVHASYFLRLLREYFVK